MSVKISKTIPSRSSLASSDGGLEKLLNPRHSKRHHACGRKTEKIKQGWATARAAASDRCSYRWWWWEEWSRNACTSWPSWESMSATPWAFCSSQLPLTSPSLLFFSSAFLELRTSASAAATASPLSLHLTLSLISSAPNRSLEIADLRLSLCRPLQIQRARARGDAVFSDLLETDSVFP